MRATQFRHGLDDIARTTRRTVFTTADLARTVLRDEGAKGVERTLAAAVRDRLLVRVCRGLYAYPYAPASGRPVGEEAVVRMRPRALSYISLESALSLWGVIDQEAIGAITVMSTGRSQRFDTPYGRIDITHTARNPTTVMGDIVAPEPGQGWLPYARPRLAARDLMRVGRNTDLIEWAEIDEVEREMASADA